MMDLYLPPKPAIIRVAEKKLLMPELFTAPTTIIVNPYALNSFRPTDIAGLEFWVRSDLGVTKDGSDLVSSWADQSGNVGRDAVMATAANQPLWVSGLVNGHAGIRFDGTNDRLVTADFAVAQPFHSFMIFRLLATTTGQRFFYTDNDANDGQPTHMQVVATTPSISIRGNGNGHAVVPLPGGTSTFHLVQGIHRGNTSRLAVNDGALQANANNLGTLAMDGLAIGSGNTANFTNCEFAEVIVYNAEITGADLTKLMSYFQSRYGLW